MDSEEEEPVVSEVEPYAGELRDMGPEPEGPTEITIYSAIHVRQG